MRSAAAVTAGLAAVAYADPLTVTHYEDVTVTYCNPTVTNCPASNTWNSWNNYPAESTSAGTWNNWNGHPPQETSVGTWNNWGGHAPEPTAAASTWAGWNGEYNGDGEYEYGYKPYPPPGWYEWEESWGPAPSGWNNWEQGSVTWAGWAPPAPSPWYGGEEVSVTVTFVEVYSVPCPTGWKEMTTTVYEPHCGCTETPKPEHPDYVTYTTTCPESWGVGTTTVTYSCPYATWTPEAAASTWAEWENVKSTPVAAASSWAEWENVKSTPVAASSEEWAKWTATASVTAACPKYTGNGMPDWFKNIPADVASSMAGKWAAGPPADWCYYSYSTAPAMKTSTVPAGASWASWSNVEASTAPAAASSTWAEWENVSKTGPNIAKWTGAANANTGSLAMAGLAGLAAIIMA